MLRKAGPFTILAAGALWLALNWDQLPPRLPVHWNWRLQPDSFATRSPLLVALPLLIGLLVCVVMVAMQAALQRSVPESAMREATLTVLLAAQYVIALVCCGMLAASATNGRLLKPMLLLSAGCVLALVIGVRSSRPIPPEPSRNPEAWRGRVFYVDRQDPALFVPKRSGFGYTFNFGHPAALLLTFVTLVIPLAIALAVLLRQ